MGNHPISLLLRLQAHAHASFGTYLRPSLVHVLHIRVRQSPAISGTSFRKILKSLQPAVVDAHQSATATPYVPAIRRTANNSYRDSESAFISPSMSAVTPPQDPATVGYFSVLLALVAEAAPELVADPTLLHALLVCLIPGDKHLVIRTSPEDISTVAKLTTSVCPIYTMLPRFRLWLRSRGHSAADIDAYERFRATRPLRLHLVISCLSTQPMHE